MKRLMIAASVLLLAGCAKTPDDVKSNVGGQNTDASIEYISADKSNEDISAALSKKYSQFDIADGISVDIPDKIYECSFVQAENYEENYSEIFAGFFDEDILSAAEIKKVESLDGMISYSFTDPALRAYGCVGNNGFICFVKPSAYQDMFLGGDRIKVYHADRSDDLSDSYMLDGGEISVGQAAELAQKWIDENYAAYEPDYDIKVKTIIARRNDMGEYSFDIHAEKIYKGIALDSLSQKMEGRKMVYATQELYMQMFKPDEIGSLTNGNGLILPRGDKEVGEIVSLSSALNYLESTFTDFNENMMINDIGLKYTLMPQNDYENDQSCYDAGIEFESRLVWEFVIDIPEEDMPKGNTEEEQASYRTLGAMQKYIYIDAQTGDMDFEFDVYNLMK